MMSNIKEKTRMTMSLFAGVLFLGVQMLVSLHYIFIDHHYHNQSNTIQLTTETEHPCKVSEYFSFNLPWNKVHLNFKLISYAVDLQLNEFQIWYIGFEKVYLNRGPPILKFNVVPEINNL